MSTNEYISMLHIGLRIFLYGGGGFIVLMIVYTILRTLKEDYRTRGFLGLFFGLFKLALLIAIVGIIVFLAIANNWIEILENLISGK